MTLCSARCLPMAQCSLSTGQVSTLQAMRLVLSLVGGHQPTQRVPCAIVHLKVALQPASAERKEGRGVFCFVCAARHLVCQSARQTMQSRITGGRVFAAGGWEHLLR